MLKSFKLALLSLLLSFVVLRAGELVKRHWWYSGARWEMNELLSRAWWIWNDKDMISDPAKRSPLLFTRKLLLDKPVRKAYLRISAQGTYALSINGREVGKDDDVVTLEQYDIKPFLKKGENIIEVRAKSDTWWAGLLVSGRIRLKSGKEIELLSDSSWTAEVEGEGNPHPAGEVSKGINGGFWNNVGRIMVMPSAWYRLNTEVRAPGIAWAKPYAGKRVKVLAIHPRGKQRDTVELIHRTDMDVRVVFPEVYRFNHKHTNAPFFPVTEGMSYEDVGARLEETLRSRPNVIILGRLGGYGGYRAEELFYDVLAEWVKSFIAEGGGLVYIGGAIPPAIVQVEGQNKPKRDNSYEKELTAEPVKEAPTSCSRARPSRVFLLSSVIGVWRWRTSSRLSASFATGRGGWCA